MITIAVLMMVMLAKKADWVDNRTVDIAELDFRLQTLLSIDEMKAIDNSLNGIQVEREDSEIKRVCCAVDACMETFRRAVALQADMVLVHHGIFWGSEQALRGEHYRRIHYLMANNLALYAVHLPLDCHPELGNNAGMAAELQLQNLVSFGSYRGKEIGCRGMLAEPRSITAIAEQLFGGVSETLAILPFGDEQVESVGIISGGATRELQQAIDAGLDLYITGDAAHTVYHLAQEAGINVMFGGHYLTETWGVRLLGRYMKQQWGLETEFIDVPSGL